MEQKQIVEAICDVLENITQSVRTRKSGEKSKTESDEYKYVNDAGNLFYKYEQVTAEHRFDCETLRKAPNALELIADGLVSDMIIDEQKVGRSLSIDAFNKKYKDPDGVTVNALDALQKAVSEVKPEAVQKQASRLSKDQSKVLLAKLMKQHNFTVEDLK